jgi:hypothetical protein
MITILTIAAAGAAIALGAAGILVLARALLRAIRSI